jgi:DNA mismatch endonuclease, patch repair protein
MNGNSATRPPSTARSAVMRAVRSVDTAPELIVRRLVYSLGFRYRLYRKDLPGTPDLAFISLQKLIFVHGCFWHGHSCKRGNRIPKTNRNYWKKKIKRNMERDKTVKRQLSRLEWKSISIWECEINNRRPEIEKKILRFLRS